MDTTLGKLIIEEDLQMIHLYPEFAVISKNIIYVHAMSKNANLLNNWPTETCLYAKESKCRAGLESGLVFVMVSV